MNALIYSPLSSQHNFNMLCIKFHDLRNVSINFILDKPDPLVTPQKKDQRRFIFKTVYMRKCRTFFFRSFPIGLITMNFSSRYLPVLNSFSISRKIKPNSDGIFFFFFSFVNLFFILVNPDVSY